MDTVFDIAETGAALLFGTTVGKFIIIVFLFALPLASLLTWMERRQSAYTQDRYGPQRASISIFGKRFAFLGLLHIVADASKMFFKEPFIPDAADRPIFRVAPLIGFVTAIVTLSLIPFGPDFVTSKGTMQLQIARLAIPHLLRL